MADDLREPLAEGVTLLRGDVMTAGTLNAKTLCASAETCLASINSFVVGTPDLQAATFWTVQNVNMLARVLYAQSHIADTEAARRQTLAAIDRLVVVLRTTTPNQRAISLGF